MNVLARAKEALIRRSFRRTARQLAEADSETLLSGMEERVLRVFRKAAKTVPAYTRLLEKEGISIAKVTSLDAFQKMAPLLTKKSWFGSDLREICSGSTLDGIASFYSSSGQTGFFSYGVETRREQKQASLFLEFALQQAFSALDRKTLLINCLPMGVRVHTRTLPLTETSVREDVVWALLRKLGGEFEQFILLGEHPFLKHLVEGGAAHTAPIDWAKLRVHIITGAEYVAENFRTYLASLLGMNLTDPNSGLLVVNYGLSEISVSICSENWHTIQIRKLAQKDSRFREALCGGENAFCPNVMQYYPTKVFLETHQVDSTRKELVVTILDLERRIPIIRYNTGDRAQLISHADLAQLLADAGHADLIPPLRLPVALIWGKCKGFEAVSGRIIYPEQVKEALYADHHLASSLTGNFRMNRENRSCGALFQLKEGVPFTKEIEVKLSREVVDHTRVEMPVKVFAYADFPFGMHHDFERKNQYLDS